MLQGKRGLVGDGCGVDRAPISHVAGRHLYVLLGDGGLRLPVIPHTPQVLNPDGALWMVR